jgi:hypothetical protein
MRISSIINIHVKSDRISAHFGMTSEQWEELFEAISRIIIIADNYDQALEMIENNIEFRTEKEAIAANYMMGLVIGRMQLVRDLVYEGEETILVSFLVHLLKIKEWATKNKIELPKKFIEMLNIHTKKVVDSILNGVFRSREDSDSHREKDASEIFKNKNKFKKGDFDIPQ